MFPIIDKRKTGYQLEYLMKINRLTPKDIQEYLSLACVQTVYRWLEGINIPTIDNLYALAELFHVRIDDMVVGSRKPIEKHSTWRKRLLSYYLIMEQRFRDRD